MIFVDSDALIGIMVPQDTHHVKANQTFDVLASKNERLITSWESIDEVATKLSMFFGKDTADKFFSFLGKSQMKIIYLDELLGMETIHIFKKQTSKNVSLTDYANVAICRSLGITHVFSFDPHYSQNNLKLLQN